MVLVRCTMLAVSWISLPSPSANTDRLVLSAISVSSASLLTEAVKGKTRSEVQSMFESIHALLTQHDANVDVAKLGKLAALSGVREFPARVKCASLCWHTLNAALESKAEPVSTE